ncbi:phospholipase D-like domain-containing protein [Sorangium sp. So ce362]|uniref:phospholipase D-like domain-containing protein n=1 Tax=Sorangium sp. So ce362 TaxID=3133303 RepID=UPI003F600C1E
MISSSIPGTPWVEDRSSDVIEDIWAPTGAATAARAPSTGRILQAEESGMLGRAVAEVVETARDVVLVSSFLFADPDTERALLDAARQRRVRVYLLVASEARLDKEVRADDAFATKTVEEHKRLLDRLAGWVYVRSAEHFHAKFVIADPKSLPRGVLLTANLTRAALTRNHELGIRLRPEEARALSGLFTWAFWESAQRELLEEGRLPPVAAPARLPLPAPAGGIVATAGTRRDLRAAVLNLIAQAKRSLVVATFGISDPEVVGLIEARARSGVAVTLLVRHPRSAMFETLSRLARAGVEVLGVSQWLHAKAIVADGARGLLLTANLEAHGLEQGFEAGVQLAGDDAGDLARVLASWRAAAASRLRASERLGELRGTVQVMNGKGYRDLTVEAKGRLDDGVTKVDCCTRIASAQPPPQRRAPDGRLYQQVEHVWSIEPPVIAKGARPSPAPKDAEGPVPPFPIHVEPGGRRVFAIDGLGELDAARAAMAAFGVQAVVLRG